ncbi:MAG: helix-turn-helix domain-containing protein, partial [Gemmatimonadaceae bacterium]
MKGEETHGRTAAIRARRTQRSVYLSELCARYGVSRGIGDKWLARYDSEGRCGLADRSRAPRMTCGRRTSGARSAPATGSIAMRSPSRTSTPDFCWHVAGSSRHRR